MILDSIPDTSHIKVGMAVTGTGVGASALVVSIDSGVQITVDVVSTADGSDITFTFGIAPSAWNHFFLIRNDTTGAIDAGWDTDLAAANIPAGYTEYRRIRSYLTDATFNLIQSIQWGDYFRWTTIITSVSEDISADWTVYKTRTVDTPLGVRSIWDGRLYCVGGGYVKQIGTSDAVPDGDTSTTPFEAAVDIASRVSIWQVVTNTSSQVEYAFYGTAGSLAVRLATVGYWDFRGKLD